MKWYEIALTGLLIAYGIILANTGEVFL